jgi:hypothetical protein
MQIVAKKSVEPYSKHEVFRSCKTGIPVLNREKKLNNNVDENKTIKIPEYYMKVICQ